MSNRLPGLVALFVALAPAVVGAAAPASATLSAPENAVLQADGPRALALLGALHPATAAEARKRVCMAARLQDRPSFPGARITGHPLPDAVLRAYRRYWSAALNPAHRAAAEKALFGQLRRLTGQRAAATRDEVQDAVSARLAALGLHNRLGRTAELYDLLLYFREDERQYPVLLPDGQRETVRVFLMRDLVSGGWARHLNCGGPGTGGFATDEGLYAVADAYDLDDESFRVNFLAHETQHYADYKRLPGLEGPELEYRAKLVELALAEQTLMKTVRAFVANQGDERANPHGWANKRVVGALVERLELAAPEQLADTAPERIRAAARALLVRDNREHGLPPAEP
ncbi:hypothetical protein CKO44_19130 [Rubrivivax gelatinosus]|uniref:hypothetical protein n=1 Tax=Rubrivivax gelatinosus TaxID=28068 RepID=UPI001905AA17|nr:hypothetical protein [Rubrivivax gelatinosus]MBK1615579.1 hypothetical protein [Rubrivivax gelatinosus]